MFCLLTTFRITVAPLLLLALATASLVYRPQVDGGSLRLVGSRSMEAPVSCWITLLQRQSPGLRVRSSLYGSGLAASELADRRGDVAPMSRPFDSGEREMFAPYQEPVALPVGSQSGSTLYLYLMAPETSPAAVAFAAVALSAEGQSPQLCSGMEPLSPERRDAALQMLANLSNE
jgi:ABC-type phosphate transport system substrate-binding protein